MTFLKKLQPHLRKCLRLWILLILLSIGQAGADEEVSTTSLRTKEGLFAVRIDRESKRLYLLRADQRGGRILKLKVRLLATGSSFTEVELRRINKEESPERYVGEIREWPKNWSGFHLLMPAADGAWREIGRSEPIGFPAHE